jgi:hypothetical protein
MMYREIIAICSQIHTKHINALCGQNVELLNVRLAVHVVTTVCYKTLRTNSAFKYQQKYLSDMVYCRVKIITHFISYMKNESTHRFIR